MKQHWCAMHCCSEVRGLPKEGDLRGGLTRTFRRRERATETKRSPTRAPGEWEWSEEPCPPGCGAPCGNRKNERKGRREGTQLSVLISEGRESKTGWGCATA